MIWHKANSILYQNSVIFGIRPLASNSLILPKCNTLGGIVLGIGKLVAIKTNNAQKNMSISTNSVIHYTERIEYLKGILKAEGFRLKYCLEELSIFSMDSPISYAIPIISFCDIPLSEVKNHIDSYGSYGIGLSKSWAKKTGLNPILYLETESKLSHFLKSQVDRIFENLDKSNKGKKLSKDSFALFGDVIRIMSYCKNYEGHLVRGKINSETYRFYDEREWRYVAQKEELNGVTAILHGSEYKIDKEKFNNKIKNCFVKFSFEDISYIIVDSENEIPEILTLLNDIYEDKCTSKELKILSTRIITKNQIYNDF